MKLSGMELLAALAAFTFSAAGQPRAMNPPYDPGMNRNMNPGMNRTMDSDMMNPDGRNTRERPLTKEELEQKNLQSIRYEEPNSPTAFRTLNARKHFLDRLITHYKDYNKDLRDPQILKEISKRIADEGLVLVPDQKPDLRTGEEFRALAAKALIRKYPKEPAALEKELTAQAKEKFRLYSPGSKITLRYYRGNKVCETSGKYYSYQYPTIYVGLGQIAFIDLVESDKVHIDAKYSKLRREEFLNDRLSKYKTERTREFTSSLNSLLTEQREHNVELGYLLTGNSWVSAREYVDSLIREHLKTWRPPAVNPAAQSEAAVDEKQVMNKVRLARENAAKHGGIDMEPGYSNTIFWGFSPAEVRFLLQHERIGIQHQADGSDLITTSDRQIASIRAEYKNGRFFRVTTVYAKGESASVVNGLMNKYGKDDLSKTGKAPAMGGPRKWTGETTTGNFEIVRSPAGEITEVRFVREEIPEDKRHAAAAPVPAPAPAKPIPPAKPAPGKAPLPTAPHGK